MESGIQRTSGTVMTLEIIAGMWYTIVNRDNVGMGDTVEKGDTLGMGDTVETGDTVEKGDTVGTGDRDNMGDTETIVQKTQLQISGNMYEL